VILLRILWEFRVRIDRVGKFESRYGPDGAWAKLFRRAPGFRETILLRDCDTPGRYVTIDVWDDRQSFEAFRAAHAAEYEEIDRLCEELTLEEKPQGSFESP
jgi:heme-degrading monooxygenase HmoA